MVLKQIFNKTYNNLCKTVNSFNRLNLLHKLFVIFLILVFLFIVVNNFGNDLPIYYSLENFDNEKKNKFTKKTDNAVYDEFYSNYYDAIHLNEKDKQFELGKIISLEKKNKYTKILDVGCGTGYNVNILNNKKYDVIGIDKSKAMVKKARNLYPKCEFVAGDILNNNIFDYGTFTHITCLGKTIYEIKDKDKFFDNCSSLLNDGGCLVVHVVNRNKFKPFIQSTDKDKDTILYDPEKYGKPVDQLIVKFDNNNELLSIFNNNSKDGGKEKGVNKEIEESNNSIDDDATPYATYVEKFQNYNTNIVRKNERNLYMPELNKILDLAKSKGFEIYRKFSMDSINRNDEYLYAFRKTL